MTIKEAITELLKYRTDAYEISDETIYLAIEALRKMDKEDKGKKK